MPGEHAIAVLMRAGMHRETNAARVAAWWARYERTTGAPPDGPAHLRALRRGLKFPVERRGEHRALALRPIGEPRT